MVANPYVSPTLANYNLSPPPDDGTKVEVNRVEWQKHIDKIGDPLATYAEAIDNAVNTAFAELSTVMPFINVKSTAYGAVGDGVTDDTAAIQAAIDAAADGDVVYFPPATGTDYLLKGSLSLPGATDDRAIKLYGGNRARLRWSATATGGMIENLTAGLGATGPKHTVDGFKLFSDTLGSGIAIRHEDSSRHVYRNLEIRDFDIGFEVKNNTANGFSENLTFENCDVRTTNTGWFLTKSATGDPSIATQHWIKCSYSGAGAANNLPVGVYLDTDVSIYRSYMDITLFTSKANGRGLWIDGVMRNVSGNVNVEDAVGVANDVGFDFGPNAAQLSVFINSDLRGLGSGNEYRFNARTFVVSGHTATETFARGSQVTGSVSTETALVVSDDGTNVTITEPSGNFATDDTITSATGGSADIDTIGSPTSAAPSGFHTSGLTGLANAGLVSLVRATTQTDIESAVDEGATSIRYRRRYSGNDSMLEQYENTNPVSFQDVQSGGMLRARMHNVGKVNTRTVTTTSTGGPDVSDTDFIRLNLTTATATEVIAYLGGTATSPTAGQSCYLYHVTSGHQLQDRAGGAIDLDLVGATDYVASAGDRHIFRYDGSLGRWTEFSRVTAT